MRIRTFALSVTAALLLARVPSVLAETAAPTVAVEKQSLFERVVELNKIQEPELDDTASKRALEKLVTQLKPELEMAHTPQEKIAALNKVLLADRQVAYLSNKYWRDATLAASLLRGKGNCLSTSTLYVVVGDALKLPIKLVLIPRHAYARWDDGQTHINIETTAGGREMTDSEYLHQYDASPEDIDRLGWGKSLGGDGLVAELLRTAAFHRMGENKLEDALALMERAEKLAPYRQDTELARYKLIADITGRRTEARDKIVEMLQRTPPLPSSVAAEALCFLAQDAAGSGDHANERKYYLLAFSKASKTQQHSILTQLAFCYRALKDFHSAVCCMELATVLMAPNDPELASALYNLAILQKNDKRLKDALRSIRRALQINPESWNLKFIEAGYMILDSQREEGLKKFELIEAPRGDAEFYEIMCAWFYSVSQQRDKFYQAFETTLTHARATHILEWIDQDVDLDVYRNEEQFKALVEKHAKRLRGQ